MNKILIILLLTMTTSCSWFIPKETECIAKPAIPPIELNELIFPEMYGILSLDSENQRICLPIDTYVQLVDNNKNIEFYVKRCKLIKKTYESYYEINPVGKLIKK